jgi:hypothetical protein
MAMHGALLHCCHAVPLHLFFGRTGNAGTTNQGYLNTPNCTMEVSEQQLLYISSNGIHDNINEVYTVTPI